MIVRIHDLASDEIWWTYRLSTGAALQDRLPTCRCRTAGRCNGLSTQNSSEERLLSYCTGGEPTSALSGHVSPWSTVRPSRFGRWNCHATTWPRRTNCRYGLATTAASCDPTSPTGSILLRRRVEARHLRGTKKTPGEWTVTEIARAPFSIAPSAEPPLAASPKQTLKELDPLPLQANQVVAELPIRNVHEFAVDGQGQIGLFREDEGKTSFVLVDSSGKLLRAISLTMQPKPNSTQWNPLCWIGGSRFVIAISEIRVDGKAKAWSVDAQTGKVEPFPAFDSPSIERLVGTSDGSFVVLSARCVPSTRSRSRSLASIARAAGNGG